MEYPQSSGIEIEYCYGLGKLDLPIRKNSWCQYYWCYESGIVRIVAGGMMSGLLGVKRLRRVSVNSSMICAPYCLMRLHSAHYQLTIGLYWISHYFIHCSNLTTYRKPCFEARWFSSFAHSIPGQEGQCRTLRYDRQHPDPMSIPSLDRGVPCH